MTNAFRMEYIYPLYSVEHMLTICTAFIFLLLGAVLFYKRSMLIDTVLILGAVFTISISLSLLMYSILTGMYDLEWYLPIHICNSFMIVYPIAIIFKGRTREFLKDYMVFGGAFGCLLYVIFPINTVPYLSIRHFACIMVWLYHITIGLVSVYLVFSGNYKKYRCYSIISILSVLIIASLFANKAWNVNFLFLNESLATFPLTAFYSFFKGGILEFAIYLLIFATILHIFIYAFSTLYKKKKA